MDISGKRIQVCLCLQSWRCLAYSLTLIMETAYLSETSVDLYRNKQRHFSVGCMGNNELGRIRKRDVVAWYGSMYSFKKSVKLYQTTRWHSSQVNTLRSAAVRTSNFTPFLTPCIPVKVNRRFGKRYHLQSRRIYKQSSEDRTVCSHHCDNLIFYFRSLCECWW